MKIEKMGFEIDYLEGYKLGQEFILHKTGEKQTLIGFKKNSTDGKVNSFIFTIDKRKEFQHCTIPETIYKNNVIVLEGFEKSKFQLVNKDHFKHLPIEIKDAYDLIQYNNEYSFKKDYRMTVNIDNNDTFFLEVCLIENIFFIPIIKYYDKNTILSVMPSIIKILNDLGFNFIYKPVSLQSLKLKALNQINTDTSIEELKETLKEICKKID